MKKLPTPSQLHLPLVQTIHELGPSRPKDICKALAERLEMPSEVSEETSIIGGSKVNTWNRKVRWARQDLVLKGFIPKGRTGIWSLTDEGKDHLLNCRPGVIVTVYETDLGKVLWAEAQTAARSVANNSLDLIFTSPPYPLNTQKDYGNLKGKEYLDWLLDHAATWKELLREDGSLFLNLGDVWEAGLPTQSIYKERLLVNLIDRIGFNLAETFFWENPTKVPASQWVTVRRCRVNPSIETIYWLSKSPNPKADNTKVLRPYSEKMLKILDAGGERRKARPSGHGTAKIGFDKDHGGSIPHNLLVATSSERSRSYFNYCKSNGLPVHPARFPSELPEFALKLTTEPGDLTADFFGGSLKLYEAATRLGRRCISSDKSLAYLKGGAGGRLAGMPGFVDHTASLALAQGA